MTPVRVGVVGLGYWGPQLVRNLYESPYADLVTVCDARPEALAQIGRRYPSLRQTTEFAEVLADSEVEAVVVATPISTHYPLARASLEAGKHTFVEKPLAGSLAEATQLAALAPDLGLVLMPGHTFLYSPPVQAIRDLIASGGLGEIYFVSTSRVNLGLHQSDASVVWDLGPHDFSILSYWLDETPVGVTALSRSCVMPDTPDVAFIQLEYASGIVANVELAWLAPSKLRRTTVVGSQKMVVYDDTSAESVRVFDSGVNLPRPRELRRVPPQLPNRRHRLAPDTDRRAFVARARGLLPCHPNRLRAPLDPAARRRGRACRRGRRALARRASTCRGQRCEQARRRTDCLLDASIERRQTTPARAEARYSASDRVRPSCGDRRCRLDGASTRGRGETCRRDARRGR